MTSGRRIGRLVAFFACLLPALASSACLARTQFRPASPLQALIEKGEYLAHAGDCVACHTEPGGKLFAGGRAIITPFGTLCSSVHLPIPVLGSGVMLVE
jgi:hypothetical protein